MQHNDNSADTQNKSVCVCLGGVFISLPVGRSAAGSWWEVRGVAG